MNDAYRMRRRDRPSQGNHELQSLFQWKLFDAASLICPLLEIPRLIILAFQEERRLRKLNIIKTGDVTPLAQIISE